MGSKCCSAGSSGDKKESSDEGSPTLEPLKRGTFLFAAQHMKKTKNGKPITNKILRTVVTEMEAIKTQTNPAVSQDMRVIHSPPYNECNKLTKYVYLSGIASLTKEKIEKYGFNLIINATYEWPKICPQLHGKEVVNIRVPVDDSGQDDISIYFDEVSDKIEENANKGGCTLVHCMAGASRSTSIVLAYLMKNENISLVNAFKSVRKRREIARPNMGFWDQLIKYEIRTRGKSSTKMITEKVNGIEVKVPDFYKTLFPDLYNWEVNKQLKEVTDKKNNPNNKPKAEKVYNAETQNYE